VYVQSIGFYYEIELAFDAILGHKSAHSFATGPVIAEPAKESMPITTNVVSLNPAQARVT
jgi:hypothetical protein